MKLKIDFRDFYYLDSELINNLLGFIEGFIQDEHSETNSNESTNHGSGGLAGMIDVGKENKSAQEIIRSGHLNAELKFKKVFDYLKSEGLEQMDTFDGALWDMMISEEEILELRGSLYFTQIYEMQRMTGLLGNFMRGLGEVQEEEIDLVTSQTAKLRKLQEKNGIPIRLKTLDGKYTFIAYLNEKFLKKAQNDLIGNDYKLLCKIEKVIPKGEKYSLFDLKEMEQNFLNREQRRQGKDLPEEFTEKVTGPAAIVTPFAIYK